MFYNQEILTRRDGKFGIIWMAATMGSRSGLTKLSKREVASVNIIKLSHDISQPPEPLALRLSSNLMYGLIRVYGQQYHFYLADVNQTFLRLQRDLAIMKTDHHNEIMMSRAEARVENITLPEQVGMEQAVLHNLRQDISADLEIEVPRDRANALAVEFGWAALSVSSHGNTPTRSDLGSSSLTGGGGGSGDGADVLLPRTEHQRRKINLEEPFELDLGLPQSDISIIRPLQRPITDDVLQSEDFGLYFDNEGNVIDRTSIAPPDPLATTAVGAPLSTTAIPPALAGRKRPLGEEVTNVSSLGIGGVGIHSAAGGIDTEGNLLPMQQDDYYFDPTEQTVLGGAVGSAGDHDMGPSASTGILSGGGLDEFEMEPTTPQPHPIPGDDDEDGRVPKRPRTGHHRRAGGGLIIDDHTMLTREQLQQAQDHAHEDLMNAKRDKEQRERVANTKTLLEMVLKQPIGVQGACPDLVQFWNSIGSNRQLVNTDSVEPSLGVTGSISQGADPSTFGSIGGSAGGGGGGGIETSLALPDPLFDQDYIPEPEIRRRQSSRDVELGRNITPWSEYVELHQAIRSRQGSLGADQRHSRRGSSLGGRSADGSGEHLHRRSSRAGSEIEFDTAFQPQDLHQREREKGKDTEQHKRRQSSVQSQGVGTSLLRRSHSPGSGIMGGGGSGAGARQRGRSELDLVGSMAPLPPFEFDDPLLPEHLSDTGTVSRRRGSRGGSIRPIRGGGGGGGAGDGGGDGSGGRGRSRSTPLSGSSAERDRDTNNFLEYTRGLLQEAGSTNFSFEEMIPLSQPRTVAASAFYHILSLSTAGITYPSQQEPYGDIIVEMVVFASG